jgi:hypothetical protein
LRILVQNRFMNRPGEGGHEHCMDTQSDRSQPERVGGCRGGCRASGSAEAGPAGPIPNDVAWVVRRSLLAGPHGRAQAVTVHALPPRRAPCLSFTRRRHPPTLAVAFSLRPRTRPCIGLLSRCFSVTVASFWL